MIYFKQETVYTCGAAVVRMILHEFGIRRTEKQCATLLSTSKVTGAAHKNFPPVFEKFKLNYVVKRNSSISDITELLKRRYIPIVNYYIPEEKLGHYAIVKSVDSREITLTDPFYGDDLKLPIIKFLRNWKGLEKDRRWFIAIGK